MHRADRARQFSQIILAATAALFSLFLGGGCGLGRERLSPAATPAPPTPTLTLTSVPPTTTPTPSPSPTPTPTPAPTIDPTQVAAEVRGIHDTTKTRSVEPICLQQGDADDDGTAEWVGLYLQSGDPPTLQGFVLDEGAWYELRPPTEAAGGMGTYPTCQLAIEDVNQDGRTEVMVEGGKEGNVDVLHIFVWQGDGYGLLASFQGDVGLETKDIDGDLIPEVIARYRAGSGFAWEAVHTWDGRHYGWTWERYTWLHADHPRPLVADQPRNTLISYYLALDDRNLPGAYSLLGGQAQAGESYETWAAGFATTLGVEVGSVREIERGAGAAVLTAQVRAFDNEDGYAVGRLWDVTWSLTLEEGGWRLDRSQAEQLDEWEAAYYE